MGGQVVHDDDIPGVEGWNEHLLDIGAERGGVHWSVEHHGCGHARTAQCTGKGGGLPMPVWNGCATALAAFGAAIDARHLRRSAGLIDEDEIGWIELRPGVQPGLAPRGDVGPVLLGCVRRFF